MPELDLSFSTELKASLDGVSTALRRHASAMERAQQAMDHAPGFPPVQGHAGTGTTGKCTFSLGGPSLGRVWMVRCLSVGGTGLTAGTARIYAVAAKPPTVGLPVIGFRDSTTFKTFPVRSRFYGTGTFVVLPLQQIWIVVVTATHTKTVSCDGQVEDYDMAAYRVVQTI